VDTSEERPVRSIVLSLASVLIELLERHDQAGGLMRAGRDVGCRSHDRSVTRRQVASHGELPPKSFQRRVPK
jgi:hypothetical protein